MTRAERLAELEKEIALHKRRMIDAHSDMINAEREWSRLQLEKTKGASSDRRDQEDVDSGMMMDM
jgi:cell division protein FtsL